MLPPNLSESPTKAEAIENLSAEGHDQAASDLDRWRNKDGQNHGWDAWFLSSEGYPDLERVVWPDGYRS